MANNLFHTVINRTNVDYGALLWWDFIYCVQQKKNVIQYPRFTKLIIVDLLKKYPFISPRVKEDYHSIKDDILLVSVYTTGNVAVQGMLIPDALLTEEIRATDDYKEYETVFVNVVVPMNQPQPVFSTQGMHRSKPSVHRTPTLTSASPQAKKRKQSAREISLPQKSLKITIKQNQDRPGSHKEHPKIIDDDEEEKKDEKEGDEMDILEIRTEKMQTPIPTTSRSPRINLSLDKNIMKSNLQYQANDPALWDVLKCKFEKSSTSKTSCREDDFQSHHDDHQEDDAPHEGEKRVKRQKESKSSKSARGSSSKRSAIDSITYVTKQQSQQQEWDAWEEENFIDEDDEIHEDETPELIIEF
ncbi:hypothetical protein Tco_0422316 [Tanacetum coccineum]